MEKINYSQLYTKLTKSLSPKTKDIFNRRFGVKTGEAETLESIGDSMGITRERVRQIEEVGFNFIKKNHQDSLNSVFKAFTEYLESRGGFKREELILQDLGGSKQKPYVLFFLTIGQDYFARVCGKKDYHYFWVLNNGLEAKVKETLNGLVETIEKGKALMPKEKLVASFASSHGLNGEATASYLEISKKIQQTKEGHYGLVHWPEVKPRGVKDKAFLVFKKMAKPLHFRQITDLIDTLDINGGEKKTHPQTVHNELIKDARFVLVGRGTYALAEWGYVPGTIKDVITKVLKDKPHLASQDEIVKEVLSQRLVAKNTVMINLNNKKYFAKDSTGKYLTRETA